MTGHMDDDIQKIRRERKICGTDKLEGALSCAAIQAGVNFHTQKQWASFLDTARAELRERGITIHGRQRNE